MKKFIDLQILADGQSAIARVSKDIDLETLQAIEAVINNAVILLDKITDIDNEQNKLYQEYLDKKKKAQKNNAKHS